MSDVADNGWADVREAAAKMFKVWADGSELAWAEEAWGHLYTAGLIGGDTILEAAAAKLRLVCLARIYQEFCGLAWDEDPETPVGYLAEDLEIDPIALGILASSDDMDQFDAADEYELRDAALISATESQREEISKCLQAAYGGDIQLYSRLAHTQSSAAEEEAEGYEFEATGSNSAALSYVMNGFQKG